MTSSQPTWTFFTPLVTLTINRITVASGPSATQTGVTYGKLGLYTYNESTGVLTLVAETANDTTLYSTASSIFTRALSNANGLPLTYTVQAGTRYACCSIMVFSGGSPSSVVVQNSTNPLGLLPRMNWYQNGQATLPTSSTLSGNPGNGFATFFRLSYV